MRDVKIATLLAKALYQAPSRIGIELDVGPGITAMITEAAL
jgi:hypothetical protein